MQSHQEVFIMDSENFVHAYHGFELSVATLLVTLVLEAWSLDTVKKLLKQKGSGYGLYIAAIMANLRNHFLFGTPLYYIAVTRFCSISAEPPHTTGRLAFVLGILVIHSFGFYIAHRLFHENASLYRFHKFHHRFNIHVPPIAANSVSPVEYIVAYILPFVIGIVLLQPDSVSVRVSVMIVSMANVMLHTPKLAGCSGVHLFPDWLVETEDHLEHHRKLNTKYSAPTFSIDYFVELFGSTALAKKGKNFND